MRTPFLPTRAVASLPVAALLAVLCPLTAVRSSAADTDPDDANPRATRKTSGILSRRASETLEDGLVLQYSFEGRKKHSEGDRSPRHNLAQINGDPKIVEGKVGKAMEFDGTDDYLEVKPFKLGGAMSVAAWVQVKHFNSWSRIVDFGEGRNAHNIVLSEGRGNSAMQWTILSGNGKRWDRLEVPAFWTLNEWTHVVATVDESGTMSVYRNGVLMQSMPGSAPEVRTRKSQLIGKSNWGQDPLFQGVLDELMIWNRALSKAEVQALYDSVETK